MSKIDIKGISFSYGDNAVISNMSLTIAAGEFVAVVGPNGAGKSTLLKLIAGLLQPDTGEILINGGDIAAVRARGLIGYVPQNYANNLGGFPITVEEVVRLGLVTARKYRPDKDHARHIVDHMLSLVGMENFSKCRIGELSGGQQQRVMVARALAGNPELLLLDEPTSGIDYVASKRIFELLARLNRNLGITVVMITHDIIQATQWTSKIACINRGLCYYDASDRFRLEHVLHGHSWL